MLCNPTSIRPSCQHGGCVLGRQARTTARSVPALRRNRSPGRRAARAAAQQRSSNTAADDDRLVPTLQFVEMAALSTAALLQVATLLSTAARASRAGAAQVAGTTAGAGAASASQGAQQQQEQQAQQTQLIVAQEVMGELAYALPSPSMLAPLQGFVVVVALMCNAMLRRLQGARWAGTC